MCVVGLCSGFGLDIANILKKLRFIPTTFHCLSINHIPLLVPFSLALIYLRTFLRQLQMLLINAIYGRRKDMFKYCLKLWNVRQKAFGGHIYLFIYLFISTCHKIIVQFNVARLFFNADLRYLFRRHFLCQP